MAKNSKGENGENAVVIKLVWAAKQAYDERLP
jgi:hypothetical protein